MRKLLPLVVVLMLIVACNNSRKASKGNFASIIESNQVPFISLVRMNHRTEKLMPHHQKMIKEGLITAEEKTVNGFNRFLITITPEGRKVSSSGGFFGPSNRSEWAISISLKNVDVSSFSEPADFLGKKVCTAEFTADIVPFDWVDRDVFLPENTTRRNGMASFILYDEGWKLEECKLKTESEFFKLSRIDQTFAPAAPTLEDLNTLMTEWLGKDPCQVDIRGISLPIRAMQRTRLNPPGNENWKTFSPLWQANVLKVTDKMAPAFQRGFVDYTFNLADDKASCYNKQTRKWRISESSEVIKLIECEPDNNLEGEMEGYKVTFSVKFTGLYPWMLQYPDVFQTVKEIQQNGCSDNFTAELAKNETGAYYIKTLKRKNKMF